MVFNAFMENVLYEWFSKAPVLQDGTIFNNVLMAELPNKNLVKIRFYSGNTADHYGGLLVEIFHKERGKLDGMEFKFNHYAHDHKDYHVWRCDGKVAWYINTPGNAMIDRITSSVIAYVEMWR